MFKPDSHSWFRPRLLVVLLALGLLASGAYATIAAAAGSPPFGEEDRYSVAEGQGLIVAAPGILQNDTDAEGDPLTAILVGWPSHGSVSLSSDGSFNYWPAFGFDGSDSFTYFANDGTSDSNLATVHITVTNVNHAPMAYGGWYTTPEDTATAVMLMGSDMDGDPLTFVVASNPISGTLSGTPPNLTYTPNLNFNGIDMFTFRANDGTVDSNPPTAVTIQVTSVNDAPVAVDDADTTPENTPIDLYVLANDYDVDGDTLSISAITTPANGLASINGDNTVGYTPNLGFNGLDAFTYTIADGNGGSAATTVSVTVGYAISANSPPTAGDDAYSMNADTPLSIAPAGVLINDADADGDPLTALKVSEPANGMLTFNADGSFTYWPFPNFNGTEAFTYKANDGSDDSNIATVTITVDAVNDPPMAYGGWYVTPENTSVVITLTGSDIDGDPLTWFVVAAPSNGTLTGAPPNLTYTPNPGFSGIDSFTIKANDGTADSPPVAVTIEVTSVNYPPSASGDAYATDEDTAITVAAAGVLGNDSDADGDPLTALKVSDPAHGTLTFNANGSFTYAPNPDFNGSDSFTYRANDGTVDSNVATVAITVTSVNDPPGAADDAYTTGEDTPLTIAAAGVLANDSDADSDPLTAVKVSDPAHGTLTLNANGSFTYVPSANFNGSDSFTYKANDGAADSNVATVAIVVTAVNDPPTISDFADRTIWEDSVTGDDFTIGDAETDPNSLVVSAASSNTTLVPNDLIHLSGSGANRYMTIWPMPNRYGTTTVTVSVSDGAITTTDGFTITVSPVNDPPTISAIAGKITDEDTPTPAIAFTIGDAETAPDSLVITGISSNTALVPNDMIMFSGFGANRSVLVWPAPDQHGTVTVTVTVSDGAAAATDSFVVTVNPVNDAPTISDIPDQTTVEDTSTAVIALVGDIDTELVSLSLTGSSSNTTMVPSANIAFGGTGAIRTVTITPAANQSGLATITITASDGAASTSDTFVLTLSPVNDAPVAADDSFGVPEDGTLSVGAPGILANDTDVERSPLTTVKVSDPSHGVLTLDPDGSFTYTPAPNYSGMDGFIYRSNDGALASNFATVIITVIPTNDAPVAVDDGFSVPEDGTLSVGLSGVLANDTDADGDSLTAIKITDPAHGTLSLGANGSFTYTPALNYYGPDSFTYRANDGSSNSNVGTVAISVNSVNDTPTISDIGNQAIDEDSSTATIPFTVGDIDTELVSLSLTGSSSNTIMVPDSNIVFGGAGANRTVTITPALNQNGSARIAITVSDGTNTSTDNLLLLVVAVNDPPTVSDIPHQTTDANAPTSPIPFTVADIDDSPDSLTLTGSSSNPTLVPGANIVFGGSGTDRTATITPAPNQSGTATITFSVADVNGATAGDSFVLTVNPANLAPVAEDDAYQTSTNAIFAAVPGVLINDHDPEGNPLAAIKVSDPAHGTLVLNANGSFTYQPSLGYYGPDSFTYRASDGSRQSTVTTVTINVSAPGYAYAWGRNTAGQLGDTSNNDRYTPLRITALAGVIALAAGDSHSLALQSDGSVKAWGDNGYGQLGDSSYTNRNAPVTVAGLANVVALAAGDSHSLALRSDGSVKAWGSNNSGQLGDGSYTNRNAPITVAGLANVVALAAGDSHSLALLSDGTVKAWGYNSYGQLGDGSYTNRSTAVTVPGLTNVAALAAGQYHSLALKWDGTVWAWGSNQYGQLGDGSTTDRVSPVQISGLANVVAIRAGYRHSLALLSDGSVKAWGYNSYGQLGDGSTTQRNTPVTVAGLANVVAVQAGYFHSLALLSNASVKAWGYNSYGSLGDGTTTNRITAVTVPGLTNVAALAAGQYHSLAYLAAANLVPAVASINPVSARAGDPGFTLSITGTNFLPTSVARWYDSVMGSQVDLATSYASPTLLTAVVPSAYITPSKTAEVTVFNQAPGGGASNLRTLYVTPLASQVTGVSSGTSTDPGGTATASQGGVTANGTGSGTVAVANYASNPGGAVTFSSGSSYFDVYLSSESSFSQVTLTICNLNGSTQLYWWNGLTWVIASSQSYNAATGCVTLTVTATTSPNLSQLKGTIFGGANLPPNVAPLGVSPPAPAALGIAGAAVSLSSTFADEAGALDGPYTVAIDWGDGAVVTDTVTEPGAISGSHVYTRAGLYPIVLVVTDQNEGSGSASYLNVVYDANAGFATGGAKFDSPAGAYAANPTAIGRVEFQFEAKYHKGGAVPKGEAELKLKAAGLELHGGSYDWLVISGRSLWLQGSGRGKDGKTYAFLIAATDANVTPGDDGSREARPPRSPRIRMRIWDKIDGALVYDSQPGAPLYAIPTTPSTAGNIIVHRDERRE